MKSGQFFVKFPATTTSHSIVYDEVPRCSASPFKSVDHNIVSSQKRSAVTEKTKAARVEDQTFVSQYNSNGKPLRSSKQQQPHPSIGSLPNQTASALHQPQKDSQSSLRQKYRESKQTIRSLQQEVQRQQQMASDRSSSR